MTVALRRSTRTGKAEGIPLEDIGLKPDFIHRMTEDDVFHGNCDLIDHAASLVLKRPVYELTGTMKYREDEVIIVLRVANVTRVDIFLDHRPRASVDISRDTAEVHFAQNELREVVRLEGFEGNKLVAVRTMSRRHQTAQRRDQE